MKKDTFVSVLKTKFTSKNKKHKKEDAHDTYESSAILRALSAKEKDLNVACVNKLARILNP